MDVHLLCYGTAFPSVCLSKDTPFHAITRKTINLELGTSPSDSPPRKPFCFGVVILIFKVTEVTKVKNHFWRCCFITIGAVKLERGAETHHKLTIKILESAVGIWNFPHSFCTLYLIQWVYYALPFGVVFETLEIHVWCITLGLEITNITTKINGVQICLILLC